MKVLFLGDIVGNTGCKSVNTYLPKLIKKNKIDFVIVNGENAAEQGIGITEEICKNLFNIGVDVITTGNHIWDEKEIISFIPKEKRLLRPQNLVEGSPGNGFGIFEIKKSKLKVAVINLMGNIFMKRCEDLFEEAKNLVEKFQLKKNADFIFVDLHGEITSEKMALGHFLDGKVSAIVGTHTHVPTMDFQILNNGTAYQTDIGMCGDYDSVIGMNKHNSIKKFLRDPTAKRHYPALGKGTISGLIVECNDLTGLADKVFPVIIGSRLQNFTV